MRIGITQSVGALSLLGALTLAMPDFVGAQAKMDNERWEQGQADLQKNLPAGMEADAYLRKLDELGYKVTATNYSNPDYLEYEVIKGNLTWEVQVDLNEDTRRATSVDIAQNVWKTDATQTALTQNMQMDRTAEGSAASEQRRARVIRNNQYSDRDRASVDEMVRELEELSVGRDKQYYKDTLRQRGYEITKINEDDTDGLELEAVKDGRSVQMEVDFDEDSGRSTEVDASSLWAESESTTRVREQQEMGKTGGSSTGHMEGESKAHMSDSSTSEEIRTRRDSSSLSERAPNTTSGMEQRSQADAYENR